MTVTIQAVTERAKNVHAIANQLNNECIVYWDERRISPFDSFKQMLDISVKDYRLHLQDDVILADNLQDYFLTLKSYMLAEDIHVFSLFAPNRKEFIEAYESGKHIVEFKNFLWLQAVIFSKTAIEEMRHYIKNYGEIKHDDVFVRDYLKKYNRKAYVHLPSLVQHNVWLGLVVGHRNDKRRMSKLFSKNYVNEL